MDTDVGLDATVRSKRTPLAAIVAILMVIPALLPAALITIGYATIYNLVVPGNYFIGASIFGFLDKIALVFFPEMIRGFIVGIIAIWTSKRFFPNSNLDAVRMATLAFWGGILLFVEVISIIYKGVSLSQLGVLSNLLGLGIGLWTIRRSAF